MLYHTRCADVCLKKETCVWATTFSVSRSPKFDYICYHIQGKITEC